MPERVDASDSRRRSVASAEYTAAPVSRHRSASSVRRLVYFMLASAWGFAVGVGGLLAALGATGQSVQPGAGAIVGPIPVLILAVAGGLVMAAAYKESKRRSR